MKKEDKKVKIINIISLFTLLIFVGTVGYKILLHTSILDSLYMTVITISTVGYGEIAPLDTEAKLFSIVLIFSGVAIAGYTFSEFMGLLLEGQFKELWRKKRMEKKIEELNNHYIICGAGSTGEVIIEQFQKNDMEFVIVDKSEAVCQKCMEHDIYAVEGNSTSAEILKQAGVERASGLISVLDNDVDNIVTVLTARGLNSDLYIISHAIEHEALENLKKVGANKTISIKEIGGRRMAALMIQPSVISFLDVVTKVGKIDINLNEVPLNSDSKLVNMTLREAAIPSRTGLIILAIKRNGDQDVFFNPGSDFVMREGDTLIVMGRDDQIDSLKKYLSEL